MTGGCTATYRVSRARPAFNDRLAYFGLDRAWATTLEDAERCQP